jgi:hypothetical protein
VPGTLVARPAPPQPAPARVDSAPPADAPAPAPEPIPCETIALPPATEALDTLRTAPAVPRRIAPLADHFGFDAAGAFRYVDPASGTLTETPLRAPRPRAVSAPGETVSSMPEAAVRLQEILAAHARLTAMGLRGAELPIALWDGSMLVQQQQRFLHVAGETRTPVTIDGSVQWTAEPLPPGRGATIITGSHLAALDLRARTCVRATAPNVSPFRAASTDGRFVAFTSCAAAACTLAAIDVDARTVRSLVSLTGTRTIVLFPVGAEPRFVAHVELDRPGTTAQTFLLLDAERGTAVRLGAPLPGWGNSLVSPDGRHVVFQRRTPAPPPDPVYPDPEPPRDRERLPACDPIGCSPGMCGDVPDHCGGTMNCGPCPEPRTRPGRRRVATDDTGLYVLDVPR